MKTVAIFGSIDASRTYEPAIRNAGGKTESCESLGAALAKVGFGLAVFSLQPFSSSNLT